MSLTAARKRHKAAASNSKLGNQKAASSRSNPVEQSSKIVSFIAKQNSGMVSSSQIVKPKEHKGLKALIGQVVDSLNLTAQHSETPFEVFDLNGAKIRSFRDLYNHQGSSFLLKNDEDLLIESLDHSTNVESQGKTKNSTDKNKDVMESKARTNKKSRRSKERRRNDGNEKQGIHAVLMNKSTSNCTYYQL